jgi:hypothetical protein
MPTIRLGIVRAALIAGIFPLAAAWGFQMSSFHPLAPPRPPARSTRPVNTPVAPAKRASAPVKSMGKLTPKMRKRIAGEMKRNAASHKTPPDKKIGR